MAPVLNFMFAVHDRLIPKQHRAGLREMLDISEYHLVKWRTGKDIFSQVEIETNSNCNRKCRICPRHKHEREPGFMPDDLYSHLLDQLASFGFRGRLSPVFYNEPMLDDRIFRLMKAARTKLPRSTIVLFTNGSLLTREKIEQLVESGVDTMIVSQYEGNLRADAAKFAEASRDLSQRARKTIRYRTLGDEHFLSNRRGLGPVKKPVTKSRCMQASLSCVIDFHGDVVLRCNDYYGNHVFGNVGREHILDIWNKPEFKKLRTHLRDGKFELEICKACASGQLQSHQPS